MVQHCDAQVFMNIPAGSSNAFDLYDCYSTKLIIHTKKGDSSPSLILTNTRSPGLLVDNLSILPPSSQIQGALRMLELELIRMWVYFWHMGFPHVIVTFVLTCVNLIILYKICCFSDVYTSGILWRGRLRSSTSPPSPYFTWLSPRV